MATHEISHYTRRNDPMPKHLKPLVSLKLDQLHNVISKNARETEHLDRKLCDITAQMEALRHQLFAFSHVRASMKTSWEQLVEQQTALQCCKAPIRRIPTEIIAEVIFFATRWQDGTMGRDERLTFMSVRSVCKLWRETSFSTPSLWRDLHIADSSLGHNPETISRRLSSWFQHCNKVEWIDVTINPLRSHYHHHILSTLSTLELLVTGIHLDECDNFAHINPLASLPKPMQATKKLTMSTLYWKHDH